MDRQMLRTIAESMRDVMHPDQADPRKQLEWLQKGLYRVEEGRWVMDRDAWLAHLLRPAEKAPATPVVRAMPDQTALRQAESPEPGLYERLKGINDSLPAQVLAAGELFGKLARLATGPIVGYLLDRPVLGLLLFAITIGVMAATVYRRDNLAWDGWQSARLLGRLR